MKTIRGKITIFFIFCLVFVGLLTGLYYENTIPLRKKLVIIENFDDLLNNILELRRYEKNFTYYHDTESLDESVFYLFKIEDQCKRLAKDINRVVGPNEYVSFRRNIIDYKHALEQNLDSVKTGNGNTRLEEIRSKGKALVDFAQALIKVKRRRIDRVLNRSLIFPLIAIVAFILLIGVVIQLLNQGILRPLSLVERATEEVAKETFTPISYPTGKQDEISRLVAGFNKMAQELESRQEQLLQSRKMASIGTFTSGIAHELNNPINNISLVVESLMEDDETMSHAERMRLYEDLMNQADRSSEIVRNLLEFSRARHPRLEEVSLERLVDKTARLVKNELRLNHITFSKEIQGQIPPLELDKSGLQQVLLNLYLNSIQAMDGGGDLKVVVELDHTGNELRMDVKDTGKGISPEHLQSIFDPFFSTKKEGEGTGLGLSVSYNIIKKLGGRIEVKSRPGKGTCFSIFLPLGEKK
jgi:two-component system, NtrC family, sensor kinase